MGCSVCSIHLVDQLISQEFSLLVIKYFVDNWFIELAFKNGQHCAAVPKVQNWKGKRQIHAFVVGSGAVVEVTELAIHVGVVGIIVSKHGARKLDYVSATIMALDVCESKVLK
ncbi:peroxisomal (S)-2-hydroxy-acid oxidase glo1 [Trifolium pratense]|uniref:Peroxisomal (S)-2-hydroxy-acid oxidase glo1 n=1 Tax=Trifolium pratense TaxID=57577 RepID=A0A2K3LU90_TRIPR|nr:peroxisomal (S)-2-hydroxy-acid oxidase glo1 [Trifolium pratense]